MIFDLIGKKFNNWTVLEISDKKKSGRNKIWKCCCNCGTISYLPTYHLTKGYSKQCKNCARIPKQYSLGSIPISMWNKILSNAKKRKITIMVDRVKMFDLLVKQDYKCALTGVSIVLPNNGKESWKHFYTASLDRIDSSKGYVEENIQWVHKDINRMKNIYSQEYFIKLCRMVTENTQRNK